MLDRGNGWLAAKLIQHTSREVVYRRGAQTVTVRAVVGTTLLKMSDEYGGIRMEYTDRDYLIRSADLIIGGEVVTPDEGDIIEDARDGHYQLMTIPGEPSWRWSDPNHHMLRIHAKKVPE